MLTLTLRKSRTRALLKLSRYLIWTSSAVEDIKPKISPSIIKDIFTKDDYLPNKTLFNSTNEAMDFYLSRFIDKNEIVATTSFAKSFQKQYNSMTYKTPKKLYYLRHRLLHLIFSSEIDMGLPSSKIIRDRFKVKSERSKMEKLKFSNIEDENNYLKFVSYLYSDNLNFKRGDKKQFLSPEDVSEYLNGLFQHYLNIPKPRPDYIQFQHLEDFLGLLMTMKKIERHQLKFKDTGVLMPYYLYEKCLTVLRDIIMADIPLTIREKRHFLYLKMSCSLQQKFGKNLKQKDGKLSDENSLIKDYLTIENPDFADISLFMKISLKFNYLKASEILYRDLIKLEQKTEYQDRYMIPALLNYHSRNGSIEQMENLLSKNVKFLTFDIRMVNILLGILLFNLGDISSADIILNKLIELGKDCPQLKQQPTDLQRRFIDKKVINSKSLQMLDEIRFFNGEYTSPLITRLKMNEDTISVFIKFLSNPRNIDVLLDESVFKNTILFRNPTTKYLQRVEEDCEQNYLARLFLFDKVIELLSLKLSDGANIIREYNRFCKLANTEDMKDLKPEYADICDYDDIKVSEFAVIFDGFVYYNCDTMRKIKDIEEISVIRSWSLESLQFLTRIYLDVYGEDSHMLFKKIMDAYYAVLSNGNFEGNDSSFQQEDLNVSNIPSKILQRKKTIFEDETVADKLRVIGVNLKGTNFSFFAARNRHDTVAELLDRCVFRDSNGNFKNSWVHEYFRSDLLNEEDRKRQRMKDLEDETDFVRNAQPNTFFLENQFIDESSKHFTFDQFFDIKDSSSNNNNDTPVYQRAVDLLLFVRQMKAFAFFFGEYLFKEKPQDYRFFNEQLKKMKVAFLTKLHQLNLEEFNDSRKMTDTGK